MGKLIIRLVINAVALWVAARILSPNIVLPSSFVGLIIVAAIFGLVNALVKPIVAILTCPINFLTLGLFTFVINALMLMLTAALSGGRLQVGGFAWALVGGIIISVVSVVLTMFLSEN